MGECIIGGAGGGAKVYTLEDVTVSGATITLPNGLTWGEIKQFVAIGFANSSSTTVLQNEKDPSSGNLGTYFNTTQLFGPMSQPASTDTTVNVSDGLYTDMTVIKYVLIVA